MCSLTKQGQSETDGEKVMRVKYLLTAILLCGIIFPLPAEENNPASRSVVLFGFSPGDTGIGAEKLADILTGMKQALVERGGYEVVVLDAALDSTEAAVLFEKLKARRGAAQAPEAIVLGDKTIAPADVEKLLRTDACVVSSLAAYASEEEQRAAGSRFKVRLKTIFDFILWKGEATRETRTVETMGYDAAAERSLEDAIRTILPQFTYESEILWARERQAVVLALNDGEAFIDRGRKQGVLPGTEFVVKGVETTADNRLVEREKALLAVSEVTEDGSVGTVLYADGTLAEGDAVEEVPRLGIELSTQAVGFIPMDPAVPPAVYAGLRITLAKGVYTLRPFIAVETLVYPFSNYQWWFTLRPFVGAEIRVRLGRLELAALPMVGLEEWVALAPGYTSTFIGFGLRGLVQVGLLVSRDVRIFLEGGYEYWFGTREGFLAGGGISVKL